MTEQTFSTTGAQPKELKLSETGRRKVLEAIAKAVEARLQVVAAGGQH